MIRTLSLGSWSPAAVVLCLAVSATGHAADVPPPTGADIVAPDAKLELLYTRTAKIEGGLTEGPACAPDGSIYFTDIPFGDYGGLIVRFDPKTRQTSIFSDDSGKANGLAFDAKGRLWACEGANGGGRCLSRWVVNLNQNQVMADKYDGKRFNAPNDLVIDKAGNVYFTDPKYLGEEKRELEHMAVYRVDTSGGVVEMTHEVSKPNGIGLSPDQKTLYVADHDNGSDDVTKPGGKPGNMMIHAFPLGDDGLVAGQRQTLVDFGAKKGCDGLTLDAEGRLYLTVREPTRPGVMVVDPKDGRELAFIPTGPAGQTGDKPVGLPSNVEFGRDAEANVLYITVDFSLVRIPLKVKGR
jgi:gluconolactonase